LLVLPLIEGGPFLTTEQSGDKQDAGTDGQPCGYNDLWRKSEISCAGADGKAVERVRTGPKDAKYSEQGPIQWGSFGLHEASRAGPSHL